MADKFAFRNTCGWKEFAIIMRIHDVRYAGCTLTGVIMSGSESLTNRSHSSQAFEARPKIYVYRHMRVELNSFTSWKHTSSPIKNRQTLANPMFIFSGTRCPTLVRKTLMCNLLVAAALKHLRFALRCWSCSPSSRPNYQGSPPPSFLETSPYIFCQMKFTDRL